MHSLKSEPIMFDASHIIMGLFTTLDFIAAVVAILAVAQDSRLVRDNIIWEMVADIIHSSDVAPLGGMSHCAWLMHRINLQSI